MPTTSMTGLQIGQLASRDLRFCPYSAVSKWPYKHLHGELRRVVSDNYFAFGIFKTHGWNVYYINTLLDCTDKPLLLLRETEVKALIDKISKELDAFVTFPNVAEEPGFQLTFPEEGSPRPRYLGRLTENCDIAELEAMVPTPGSGAEEAEELDDRSFPMFRHQMQLALESGKQKNKAARDKRKLDRIDVKKKRCAELKRAQCYLGLRERGVVHESAFQTGPNMSWEESQRAQAAFDIANGITVPELDPSVPAPCPFHRAPVFICVDIEVWEHNHRNLTEIGVCTLDTQDLINKPPGEKCQDWIRHLRCRHFRVKENAHLNNVQFVAGCADRFEFGQSEWISIKDIPYVLASCFKAPFSTPGEHTPYPTDPNRASSHNPKSMQTKTDPHKQKRNIILVGHGISSDIGFMRQAGYDVGNLPNVIEAIDTTVLFRAFKHEQNPRNLGAVLLELGMTGWNLHNAGNDAAYTMQALLAISLAAMSPTNAPRADPSAEELTEAEAAARDHIREDYEEWALAEAEGGDGGDPVALLPWSEAQRKAEFDKGMKNAEKAERKREKDSARRAVGRGGSRYSTRGQQRFGRGGRGGGGGGQKQKEPKVQTLDVDAMDEAMLGLGATASTDGYAGTDLGWEMGGDDWASGPVNPRRQERAGASSTSGYTPPHRRQARPTADPIPENMAARLKALDMDS